MTSQQIRQRVPHYLSPYVANQDPALYTAMDHAGWRFIMRLSREFFSRHAHQKYLDGLRETGISTERIPLISEMDDCLARFGWHAVPVVGFIPPAVFMEFLSLGILPIACDMRRPEHLGYTPAPDIVHEAAGHAPIIADPQYAAYLHQYGEIAPKVLFHREDLEIYEAIRKLSDIKENPAVSREQIAEAQAELDRRCAAATEVSEATQLGRMGWWTIEYGLVGDLKDPKIYGAGLLSSVSESYHCLSAKVRKVPFSLDCIHVSYDITRPQPQLFVTPDFPTLGRVLEEFSRGLAVRTGGTSGLRKALRARTTTTALLDSGLAVSGTLVELRGAGGMEAAVLRYASPCQFSVAGQDVRNIAEEGTSENAPENVIVALGKLADGANPFALEIPDPDGRRVCVRFESGATVEGKIAASPVFKQGLLRRDGQTLAVRFEGGVVRCGGETIFASDRALVLVFGTRVVSVFGGAGDRSRFQSEERPQPPAVPKTNLTPANEALNRLYARVRELRDEKNMPERHRALTGVLAELNRDYPEEWLLRLEILELEPALAPELKRSLARISEKLPDQAEMIARGVGLGVQSTHEE